MPDMSQCCDAAADAVAGDGKVWFARLLLFTAGLGGLLYGIDVGIIAGALPYLEATSGSTPAALLRRRGRAWGQRDFDAVRRHIGRSGWDARS